MKAVLVSLLLIACGSSESKPDPTPGPASGAAPAEPADSIEVLGEHIDKKPTNPVVLHFERFKVTKASFDPKNLEGGTATIEIDLTSLKSDKPGRDKHLKSEDYLDVGKFATLTIAIDHVKKAGAKYTADADIKLHGIEKTYPVTFAVVSVGADSIRIKGEHEFPRLDFKIGQPVGGQDESVAPNLKIRLALTLHKT